MPFSILHGSCSFICRTYSNTLQCTDLTAAIPVVGHLSLACGKHESNNMQMLTDYVRPADTLTIRLVHHLATCIRLSIRGCCTLSLSTVSMFHSASQLALDGHLAKKVVMCRKQLSQHNV